jgi:hypothetical protein
LQSQNKSIAGYTRLRRRIFPNTERLTSTMPCHTREMVVGGKKYPPEGDWPRV